MEALRRQRAKLQQAIEEQGAKKRYKSMKGDSSDDGGEGFQLP